MTLRMWDNLAGSWRKMPWKPAEDGRRINNNLCSVPQSIASQTTSQHHHCLAQIERRIATKLSNLLFGHTGTTMSSSFEPSLSTSRPPIGGPSIADTLPNINFGFDELRDRMAKFTARFDAFIEQGRKRLLEERNQFRMNVAELQGTQDIPDLPS
jgi:hypothetical protein